MTTDVLWTTSFFAVYVRCLETARGLNVVRMIFMAHACIVHSHKPSFVVNVTDQDPLPP